jgi:hypothetical protein
MFLRPFEPELVENPGDESDYAGDDGCDHEGGFPGMGGAAGDESEDEDGDGGDEEEVADPARGVSTHFLADMQDTGSREKRRERERTSAPIHLLHLFSNASFRRL